MSCSVAVQHSPVFSSQSPSAGSPASPARILRLQKAAAQPSGFMIRTTIECCNSSVSGVSGPTSPSVTKRKRPTRLDIPVVSMSFGSIPAREAAEVVEEEGEGFVVCCKRGRRESMEDRYSALVNLKGDSKQAIFGVFDGHGGAKAAEFAAGNLGKNIVDRVEEGDDEMNVAVKEGYLKTDSQFLEKDARGGSCCVTALIRKGSLVVSNAGDCRAVVSKDGVAEALTSDHRPSREDEKHRIESLGGYVEFRNGASRILGSLAVSRGIGDQYLKQWVTAEPETRILSLKPELEFLILASDGLWDKVDNQEAVDIVRHLCKGVEKPQPLSACKKLVDLSVTRGSSDDITVMLIQLTQFC